MATSVRLFAAAALLLTAVSAYSQSPLPPGVSVIRDVTYGRDPLQRFDVYLPAQRVTNAPVIFMVHGGGWRTGDKRHPPVVANKVARWVPRGFVFISVNYRLVPEADALAQAHDVAKALATAQNRAVQWGASRDRFVLMGHSAGAHLIALVATDVRLAEKHGVRPWLGAIPLDSAALDVVDIMNRPHRDIYDDAFGSNPFLWRAASPEHQFLAPRPPFLIVCSTERPAPCDQAKDFRIVGRSLGVRVEPHPVALTHGDINAMLGLPSAYTERVERFMSSLSPAIARLL